VLSRSLLASLPDGGRECTSASPSRRDSLAAMSSNVSNPVARAADERDFDENGVDLSLIRYSLSLTPSERLQSVENFMKAMSTVRRLSAPER
jgi:hypothetical protein